MRYNSGTMEVVMNSNKKDKNWIYHLIIAVLVVILIVVVFILRKVLSRSALLLARAPGD